LQQLTIEHRNPPGNCKQALPGLDPGIHVLESAIASTKEGVDGRDKSRCAAWDSELSRLTNVGCQEVGDSVEHIGVGWSGNWGHPESLPEAGNISAHSVFPA
jgi:hypothetical protein